MQTQTILANTILKCEPARVRLDCVIVVGKFVFGNKASKYRAANSKQASNWLVIFKNGVRKNHVKTILARTKGESGVR